MADGVTSEEFTRPYILVHFPY